MHPVNSELIGFYWELGKEIVEKQRKTKWGSKFLERLSKDLMSEFLDVKGFSKRNFEQIRKWYLFCNEYLQIAKQPATQILSLITQITWWHNVIIISKFIHANKSKNLSQNMQVNLIFIFQQLIRYLKQTRII
jgi:hypothetical protein